MLDDLDSFERTSTSSRTGHRFMCSKCTLSIGADVPGFGFQDLVCCDGRFPGAPCVNSIHVLCAKSTSVVLTGTSPSWMATGDMKVALCPACFRAKEQVNYYYRYYYYYY